MCVMYLHMFMYVYMYTKLREYFFCCVHSGTRI